MATISLMLIFNTSAGLAGCGIDAENADRFARWKREGREPSPLIFSTREIGHCASLPDEPGGFCASFCCKEAVFKALGQPFNGPECELFWMPDTEQYSIGLSERLRADYRLSGGRAVVEMHPPGEFVVQAYLFRDGE